MLTETNKMVLMNDLYEKIDFRYPLTSGSYQYDFNTPNHRTVYRGKEPLRMVYPAIKVDFLPVTNFVAGGLNHVYSEVSGTIIYAHGQIESVIVTAYAHQQCSGASGRGYHGKPIVDDLIRRSKLRIRKYWPAILQEMEASLKSSLGFQIIDITDLQQGTERQAFEMTFYIATTEKWDLLIDSSDTGDIYFTDAIVSGIDQASYDAGLDYDKYYTVSGNII